MNAKGAKGSKEGGEDSFTTEDAEVRRGEAEKMVWQGRGECVEWVAWASRLGGLPVEWGAAGG